MFINLFIPRLKQHIMQPDYYIKEGQTAGTQFRLHSTLTCTAHTDGEEETAVTPKENVDTVDKGIYSLNSKKLSTL